MRITEPISGIEGVASGASPTVKIPNNRRLHMARLYASALNATPAAVYGVGVVDEVYIYVGTVLLRTITSDELAFLAAFAKVTLTQSTDGLPIYFSDPKRASVMDEQVTAWDLWGTKEVTIKVKIKAALTDVVLTADMVYDDGYTLNAKQERVLNIIKQEATYVNAGTVYDLMGIDTSFPIQRIFLFPAAGSTISAVKVTKDENLTVHDLTQAKNKAHLAEYGLVAETGNGKCYPVVFDANGQLFDGLPACKSIKINITQSVAGPIKALVERRVPQYA